MILIFCCFGFGFLSFREEHIEKKIQGVVSEAKAKMAKGDKKGTFLNKSSMDSAV